MYVNCKLVGIKKEKKKKGMILLFKSRNFLGACMYIGRFTDFRRPMKPFFIEIPNFWAWADKLDR